MVRRSSASASATCGGLWNSPANPAGPLLYMIGKEWNK